MSELRSEYFDSETLVPQILENGISADFRNEYAAIVVGVDLAINHQDHAEEIINILVEKQVEFGKFLRRYEERFPKSKYLDVINSKNSDKIRLLDALVDECNELMESICFDTNLNPIEKIKKIDLDILPKIEAMESILKSKSVPEA